MIWATVSSQSCFCWLYRASPSLAAKNRKNLILVLTIWWCTCVVFSCVVERGCLLWLVHSLGKTLLAFALLHSILQGQICLLLQVFLDFLLLHSNWSQGDSKQQRLSFWQANKHVMNCLWPEAHDKAWGQLQGAECANQDPSRQWGLQSYSHKELNSDSNQGSWKRPLSYRHDHSLIWHLDSAWKDPKQRDQNCKIISRYCFKVLSMYSFALQQ